MALLNLNKSQYNAEIKKQNKILSDLQKQNAKRFNYPADYETDEADQLKGLLPITWNNICFPVTKISTDIDHDIVQHKYPNRDGARLEPMGRNPIIVKVIAVFANTINPGINEYWEKGTLYPNIYKKMLYASLESETQVLNHPFIGPIEAKIESFKPILDGKVRGGEVVEIVFIETITDYEAEYVFSETDNAAQAATIIDTAFGNLNPNPKDLGLPVYKKTLTDTLNEVKGTINNTENAVRDAYSTRAIDEVIGRCDEIITATKKLNSSTYAFLKQTATILKSSVMTLKLSSDIATLITVKPATLASYVIETRNELVTELMYLNPKLAAFPIVPTNTEIRYYKK